MLPLPADALAAFDAWYAQAKHSEPRVPDAMQVATVDAGGRPTVRTVLLKEHDARGFVFYTNLGSRKASSLHDAPHVAAVFHWKSLERQVVIDGVAEPVGDQDADEYFASRPRGSQLGAWASRQSAPLTDRDELDRRLAEVSTRFGDGPVPRPPFWSGYLVRPTRLELWQGRADRLHERRVFALGLH